MDSGVDVLEASSHTHDNKGVLDGITAVKVAAWDAAKADAISSAKTYTDATIEGLNLASTYEAKGTAQNLINGLKLPETYAKKEVESTISTLVGEDTGKSVRSVSAEEVAKIVAGADASFDTLKEIADWILNDTTGAAHMANSITALQELVGDVAVATQIANAIADADLDKYALAADLTALANRVKTLEDAGYQTADAVASAIDAKIAALNLAETYDAKGAAASAETNAKVYADGLAKNYDVAGAAAQALVDAKAYTDAEAAKHETKGAAAQALTDAKAYTDTEVAKIQALTEAEIDAAIASANA